MKSECQQLETLINRWKVLDRAARESSLQLKQGDTPLKKFIGNSLHAHDGLTISMEFFSDFPHSVFPCPITIA